MCVNQQCRDVSSLNTIPCASTCQSSEVCSNLGQCQSTIGSCQQSSTATATDTTQTQTTNTPVSTTTTPSPSTTARLTQTAGTPSPTTRSPTLTGSSTPSSSTQTTTIVLGVVLGALCLALAAGLLYTCCRNPGTLSANAGPSNATPPVESVSNRGLSTPAQTELQRISAEQYYLPHRDIYNTRVTPQTENLQQDWRLMEKTGQPVVGGYQYPNAFYPYSSRDNIASVYLTSSDNNMKVPQIVIR